MSEAHPQQWLLDQMVEAGRSERWLVYDSLGNPSRSPTLVEIEQAEAKVVRMKAEYEQAEVEGNRYRDAAEFLRKAMGIE